MAFDLPRNTVFAIRALDIRLDPAPHPFEVEHASGIAANWQRETAANPYLFDGTVALLSELRHRDGALEGRCHAVRYSTFLHWRRLKPSGAEHAYAHAVLAARDGTLVAIRMGAHTTNPDRVYFAAGSFEPCDFPDGRVDLDANMRREVLEETGIDLDGADREPGLHALSLPSGTVVFRRYRMEESAGHLARLVAAHVASDPQPEVAAPVLIRSGEPLPEGLMPHMPALIEWHFRTWQGSLQTAREYR